MCCQPPLDNDDIDELFHRNVQIIRRAPKEIPVVGISGGEPTLLDARLIELIKIIRQELPNSDIHLLSNGRNFRDATYAKAVAEAADGRLFLGIPLHSDYWRDHDIIAGAKGAFNETIAGLYNIAAFGVTIELRIVINALNYMRLPQMAEFIHKNLSFVSWTAFMGMEHIGYAVSNELHCWIEPIDYSSYLAEAATTLAQWHHEVSIYNIPLCLLPKSIHSFAKKSISDWKTTYLPICDDCSVKAECCGLFATSRRPYKSLKKL